MNDSNQDPRYQDEFLWLDKKKGRASKETKAERELSKRVERFERKLEGVERKLESKRS
jgi:hypothetical protein